jgi:hypothetical protein
MRMFQKLTAILLAVVLLTSCGTQFPSPTLQNDPQSLSPSPTTSASASAATQTLQPEKSLPESSSTQNPGESATETPQTASSTLLARANYQLTAELNYAEHYLSVEEEIHYPNLNGEALPDLLLMVEPASYPGVFNLKSLAFTSAGSGAAQPISNFQWDGSQIRIPLDEPLLPDESIVLQIAYELFLPPPPTARDSRPVPFGYTPLQTNLVDWYPFIPPYVPGQGWLAHPAGYFGEHTAYANSDFEVNVRLMDAREDLVIAASAPERLDGDWHRYRLDSARNFAFSVSDQYRVITRSVGSVTVIGYAFPYHDQAGEMALQTTAQALELYSNLFGPYPHASLSVVEADFLDGMEYDGLYFLSKGFYNLYPSQSLDYLITIAAHETAHQWWYGLVGNDQALEPWLDEALCTYSERIFYENVDPRALEDWWTYRINMNNPQGPINRSIYDFGGYLQPYLTYRDSIYLEGALFMEDLRKLVGDDAFFAFLRDYVETNRYDLSNTEKFFAILKGHTSQDLTPLKEKYFSR